MVYLSALWLRFLQMFRNSSAGLGGLILLTLAACSSSSENAACKKGAVRLSMTCAEGVNADQIAFVWTAGDKTHQASTTEFGCGDKPVFYEFALAEGETASGSTLELLATPLKGGKPIGKALLVSAPVASGCTVAEVHLDRSLVDGFVPPAPKGDATCKKDQHVVAKACVACPAGSTNAAGDTASASDTECDPVLCKADQSVQGHSCVSCPSATSRAAGDDASGADTTCGAGLCNADQHVVAKSCVSCPAGTTNAAGDDGAGPDTACDPVLCKQNQRVVAKACVSCPSGTVNAAGDDASLADTSCDSVVCGQNQRVQAHACVSCAAGTTNAAGDDAGGGDTLCDLTLCGANTRVQAHMCVACPAGATNVAGDDASAADTSCDGTRCASNQHVVANACVACPAGTTNAAGDDGTGANTSCDAVLCKINERVLANVCETCPSGSTNAAGDDSSLANTTCDPVVCLVDQRVEAHVCVACPKGSKNAAGNGATGADTMCTPVLCMMDQRVMENACVPCPKGTTNAAGDNSLGANTSCDAVRCKKDEYVQANACLPCATGSNNEAGDDSSGANTSCESDACSLALGVLCATFNEAYLKASNADAGDNFGYPLALSGDTLVVGAISESSNAQGIEGNQTSNTGAQANNAATDSGAVYVFVRSGNVWTQQAYIKSSNSEAGDQFGTSVALSGNTLVVGATGEDSNAKVVGGDQANNTATDSGAAYVFVRNGTTWSQQAYLKGPELAAGDSFGEAVAVSGDTIAVGAARKDASVSLVNTGLVYVFARMGVTWSHQASLKAAQADAEDRFGAALALSGDTLAVGAANEDSNAKTVNGDETNDDAKDSGAVYVFVRTGANWTQQAYLKASKADPDDWFGVSLALSEDTLAVGANYEGSGTAPSSGAVFVFVRTGASWSEQAYLKASNADADDIFGTSVALSGNTLVVGAPGEDSNAVGLNGAETNNDATDAGAAYIFVRTGAVWTQKTYLKASNTGADDFFGLSVTVSGNTLAVDASLEDGESRGVNGNQTTNGSRGSGAVYVRRIAP